MRSVTEKSGGGEVIIRSILCNMIEERVKINTTTSTHQVFNCRKH